MSVHLRKEAPSSSAPRRAPAGAPLPPWLRHALRITLNLAADAAAVSAAYFFAYRLRFFSPFWLDRFPIPGDLPSWALYQQLLYSIVPLWLMIFWYSSRLYDTHWTRGADRFLRILKGCALGTVLTLVSAYIYSRLAYSRMMLALAFPMSVLLVSTGQALVLWFDDWMSRHEDAKPVLLIGGAAIAELIKERIRERHPGASIHELRGLPDAVKLEASLQEHAFFEVILLNSSIPHDQVLRAAEVCDARGVAFKMVPDLLELRLGEVQMDHSLGCRPTASSTLR